MRFRSLRKDVANNKKKIQEVEETMEGVAANSKKIEAVVKDVTTNNQVIADLCNSTQAEVEDLSSSINSIEDKLKTDVFCGFQDSILTGIVNYDYVYAEVNDQNSNLDKDSGKFKAGKKGVYLVMISIASVTATDS